jgi:hypothetical protein
MHLCIGPTILFLFSESTAYAREQKTVSNLAHDAPLHAFLGRDPYCIRVYAFLSR